MPGIVRHTPELTGDKIIRAVSIDAALLPHVGDALSNLTYWYNWIEIGDTVEDITEATSDILDDYYSNMLVGTVSLFLVNPPIGWLLLDGSTYALADYPELAPLLDDSLKAGANFILPDVADAFVYGVDVKADAGAVIGDNVLNLTVGQLPSHTHTYTPPVLTVEAETPTTPIPTAGIGSPTQTGATGDGDDIDKRPLRFGLMFAVFAGRE